MAKSTRSKVKRHFRAKKRTEGVYAATEAARIDRLHKKLKALTTKGDEEEEEVVSSFGDEGDNQMRDDEQPVETAGEATGDTMDLDTPQQPSEDSKRISTHGPRGSRREQWRLSKGMSARPPRKGMNRQGDVPARRKAGRSQRRR